jgi:hypothetical protein
MIRRTAATGPGTVRSRPLIASAVPVLLIAALSGCSSVTTVHRQPVAEATAVPTSRAAVPRGWVVRRGPGFTFALPAAWQPRPEAQRAAPSAAMEIGVPFTGQPTPPPVLMAFVEREQVGPLSIREQVLRAQLGTGLPGSTIGKSQHVAVAGGTDAVWLDVLYEDEGGTSVLGTTLKPCTFRQRELIVETPGLPKYGFRFTATTGEFDARLWQKLVESIAVTPGAAEGASTDTSPVSG